MNRATMIFLGLIAALLSLCLCAAGGGYVLVSAGERALAGAIRTDPAEVARISAAIAAYTLPDGFGNPFAYQGAGFSLVGYTGGDGHSHIYLCKVPRYAHLLEGEIKRQIRELAPDPLPSHPAEMALVDRRTATIRGQEVLLLVSEGINSDGELFRQVSGVFQGKNGFTLLAFERPASRWDQAEVDSFLASIQ